MSDYKQYQHKTFNCGYCFKRIGRSGVQCGGNPPFKQRTARNRRRAESRIVFAEQSEGMCDVCGELWRCEWVGYCMNDTSSWPCDCDDCPACDPVGYARASRIEEKYGDSIRAADALARSGA